MRTEYDLEMLREVGYLPRDRELLPPPARARAGRAADLPARLLPRGLPHGHRRDRTSPCRRSAACTTGTARASRRWSTSASGCPRRSTTGRSASTSSSSCSARSIYRLGHPGRVRAARRRAAWWSSRSSARPAWSIPQIVGPPDREARSTICWRRSASASKRQERVLVTTLTKRMAEDLTDYLLEAGVKVRYIHSDVDAIERMEILRGLRLGEVRRPGRDQPPARGARPARGLAGRDPRRRQGGVPPVASVSLIQTAGRAARNVMGSVHPLRRHDDRLAWSARLAETNRRRDEAARVQPGARDHPAHDREDGRGDPAGDVGGRRGHGDRRRGNLAERRAQPGSRRFDGAARAGDARRGGPRGVRGRGGLPRPAGRAPSLDGKGTGTCGWKPSPYPWSASR